MEKIRRYIKAYWPYMIFGAIAGVVLFATWYSTLPVE